VIISPPLTKQRHEAEEHFAYMSKEFGRQWMLDALHGEAILMETPLDLSGIDWSDLLEP
jgi:hypothetical protein